jgi:hypothetical protein
MAISVIMWQGIDAKNLIDLVAQYINHKRLIQRRIEGKHTADFCKIANITVCQLTQCIILDTITAIFFVKWQTRKPLIEIPLKRPQRHIKIFSKLLKVEARALIETRNDPRQPRSDRIVFFSAHASAPINIDILEGVQTNFCNTTLAQNWDPIPKNASQNR